MKTVLIKMTIVGGCVMTLVASGGVDSPAYENLNSTAAKTSVLAGQSVQVNGTTGTLTLLNTTGSLTHDTGATTVSDGTYTLIDSDGHNNGVTSDGSGGTIVVDGTQGYSGTYEYVRAYDQAYTSGGTSYTSTGIGGVVTSTEDVPSSGTATYTGESIGQIITATSGTDLNSGTSTVNADFGNGTVNVNMTGFSAVDQTTGLAVTAPFDTISATGMTISGNGFSGGTLTTTNGGATVLVTGASTTNSAGGNFYGQDAAGSIPDEVGGMVLIQGDSGTIVGGFIAD